MAFDEEFCPLHGLTKKGEEDYRKFLEKKADEILFKHQHPFKWIWQNMKCVFNRYERHNVRI